MRNWRLGAALLMASVFVWSGANSSAADAPQLTRKQDIIYARKFGTALTMDVFTPAKPNGLGIVWVVSGGWFSSHDNIDPQRVAELLADGYTIFAVVHGCQPKFTIPEILEDMNRSVRFIRHNAKEYGIDPDHIGVTGGSAGGHLSLMLGLAGKAGDPEAKDPVDRESGRIQAVACFFPPTDFLNYGQPGEIALGTGTLKNFHAPFDFHRLDPASKSFVPITDEKERQEIGKTISPINFVTQDDPPVMIIHGDADTLVPIQQSEILMAKLKEAGVPCELVRKPGARHGWSDVNHDMDQFASWFDKYLKDKK